MFKGFKKNRGMTIVELLVAIVIFAVISGVVLFNYGDFNSSLTIQNLADDIALTIRRAQSYAIGVRGSSGAFDLGYGVHFRVFEYDPVSPDELYSGSNKSFVLFQGLHEPKYRIVGDNNCGEGTNCLEMLYIRSSDYVEEILVRPSSIDEDVSLGEGKTLDIYFERPNPEPKMCISDMRPDSPCEYIQESFLTSSDIQEAKIVISNLKDPTNKKVISIFNSGQISVSNYEEQEN